MTTLNRPNWDEYFMEVAELTAKRSTCLRRQVGAVIVKDKRIVATGYNGAPRGRINCCDLGYCTKKQLLPNQRHGGYDACRSVHSEQNAIISASRQEMIGSTLYLVGYRTENHDYEEGAAPCLMCRKLIINAGIDKVIVRVNKEEFKTFLVQEWIENDELLNGQLQY